MAHPAYPAKCTRGALPCFAVTVAVLLISAYLLAGCNPGKAGSLQRKGVITFAPNITETVFALGAGDRVVAVSSFCDYPPAIAALPHVGGHIDPDLEKITLLNPELIIVQGKHSVMAELCEKNGIPIAHVDMDSLDTVYEGVLTIGQALGCPTEAEVLNSRIENELESVRESVKGLPHPKVLLITARQDHNLNTLYTVGGPSFLSELLAVAGGENIYGDADQPYLEASKETVVVRAPDIILEFHAGEELSDDESKRYVADWEQLPSLPAVRNGRVHLITESHAMRPGPRVAEIARLLAALLHPEGAAPKP